MLWRNDLYHIHLIAFRPPVKPQVLLPDLSSIWPFLSSFTIYSKYFEFVFPILHCTVVADRTRRIVQTPALFRLSIIIPLLSQSGLEISQVPSGETALTRN